MNKWIAEFELEDGDTMPEHMDLEYKGARIDFYCRPLEQEPTTKNDLGVDCIDRAKAQTEIEMNAFRYTLAKERGGMGQVEWSDQLLKVSDAVNIIRELPSVTPQEPKAEDCISREKAIASIKWWFDILKQNPDILIDSIKTLPSVYPKNDNSVLEDIKAECIRAVDKIPITFSKNDADDCLKRDIREIFDKYISGSEKE